ncbi:MAG: hypothetical protein ABF636_01555 [Acetobacter sp.]
MPVEMMSNPQMMVEISPGSAPTAPVSIQSFAFDADGDMTVTLTDGTVLPSVSCASMLAAALGGKFLVVADDAGNIFANGKKIGSTA